MLFNNIVWVVLIVWKSFLGKVQNVLIEGVSKKSKEHFYGRNSENAVVVFPKNKKYPGEYVDVVIKKFTSATLIGELKE